MKKTQEIIGLPIISIFDGTEIGTVKNLVINADDRSISFLVVDNGLHLLGAKVISTDRILGIGEYAVTVEDENVVSMISKLPSAVELLEKNVQIKGSKVLTKKGRMAGEITELFVDEEDRCRIKGMEFVPLNSGLSDTNAKFLPDKCVITYGKHLVIVFEAFDSMLTDLGDGAADEPVAAPQRQETFPAPPVSPPGAPQPAVSESAPAPAFAPPPILEAAAPFVSAVPIAQVSPIAQASPTVPFVSAAPPNAPIAQAAPVAPAAEYATETAADAGARTDAMADAVEPAAATATMTTAAVEIAETITAAEPPDSDKTGDSADSAAFGGTDGQSFAGQSGEASADAADAPSESAADAAAESAVSDETGGAVGSAALDKTDGEALTAGETFVLNAQTEDITAQTGEQDSGTGLAESGAGQTDDDGEVILGADQKALAAAGEVGGMAGETGGEAEEAADDEADSDIAAEAGLFDERQKQYLLGRTITKTILDNRGNVLVEEGAKITEDVINSAKAIGKMVQLVMNNRA
ncbi:MAG: PRC-barrel domain-containing protein [Clostridiales bacterium]|jgi:uncharacterized protein YrrD|nr:PRC-barrel domain-containing protein [Clostridiales bacterium]